MNSDNTRGSEKIILPNIADRYKYSGVFLMTTTARFSKRSKAIGSLFQKANLKRIWKKYTWDQLRKMDIKDLFDYYDYNFRIDLESEDLRSQLMSGEFTPSPPIYYKLEKKMGICRHMIIPTPSDALILQLITEEIRDSIIDNSPTKKAFYSRDKSIKQKGLHEVTSDDYETWFDIWKRYQKEILSFIDSHEFLVLTDVANFFDNVRLENLRDYLSSTFDIKEYILDIIFMILDQVCWTPDYMQMSSKFLPTVNVESIRLLAHSLLFELDSVIFSHAGNNFTRWMDDVVFGSNDYNFASKVLGDASEVLKSRGLALNLSKTCMFSSDEARFHFQIEQNETLDKHSQLDASNITDDKIKALMDEFIEYQTQGSLNSSAKHWDRIIKRYFTLFAKLKAEIPSSIVKDAMVKTPGLRPSAFKYLLSLGYSSKTSKLILEIMPNLRKHDDTVLFGICNLLSLWNITRDDDGFEFVKLFDKHLYHICDYKNNQFDFYSSLWFKAKYYSPRRLLDFVYKFENYWRKYRFLQRQVTAVLPRIRQDSNALALIMRQSTSSIREVSTLANAILEIMSTDKGSIKSYVIPDNLKRPYSNPRFMALCASLSNAAFLRKIHENDNLRHRLLNVLKDDFYIHWINTAFLD